jgi:uncharacterized protein YbjQ (UPF0145 family)
MSVGRILIAKYSVRVVEVILAAWILRDAAVRFVDTGSQDAAVESVIFVAVLLAAIEASMWLAPRLVSWAKRKWHVSADEVLVRSIQLFIIAAMVSDAAAWLVTGEGFGVHQPGCLLSVVILEGIIRRFIRPDPRPSVMAHALTGIRKKVKVFTHLPSGKVKETFGLVRGISDIEASSRLDFELAEQEALFLMLNQAWELGANAVVDARLTTGTYETNGSQWQVSRPVYTGTAVRI